MRQIFLILPLHLMAAKGGAGEILLMSMQLPVVWLVKLVMISFYLIALTIQALLQALMAVAEPTK